MYIYNIAGCLHRMPIGCNLHPHRAILSAAFEMHQLYVVHPCWSIAFLDTSGHHALIHVNYK